MRPSGNMAVLLPILLIWAVQAISFGDFSPMTNCSSFSNNRVQLQLQVHPPTNQLTVYFKLQGFGPFGLLYQSTGMHSDFDLIRPLTNSIALFDSHLQVGKNTPHTATVQSLDILGYDSDLASYIVIKYTRPLSTGDSQDASLQYGMNLTVSAVYPSDRSTFGRQEYDQASYSGELNNSIVTALNAPSVIDLGLLHGVLLTLAWCFLADFGVWVKYIYELKQRVMIHGIIMFICVALSLAMQGLALSGMMIDLSMKPAGLSVHIVIGLIALGWTSLQFIVGVVIRLLLRGENVSPNAIVLLRKIHRVSGYLLLILAKVNTLIGWYISDTFVAFGILIAEIVFVFVLRVLYVRRMSQKILGKEQNTDSFGQGHGVAPQSDHILKLMELPYNNSEVQDKNLLIFNDKVYAVPSVDFHPGGRKIIGLVNGRQVDRFIYGMYSLELLSTLERFEHPKKTLFVLENPLCVLPPNPMCTLPQSNFFVKAKVHVTDDINILYFEPFGGQIVYQPMKSSLHLGQYFCVTGFQTTRLYTCVLSQLKTNRKLCESIATELVPSERILKKQIYINSSTSFLTEESMVEMNDSPVKNQDILGYTVPLIIKRYRNRPESFTQKLYSASAVEINITGPKGRGLCLEKIPRGVVVLIAGGTGLFPYLDLLDLLFKATVTGKIKTQIPQNQLELAQRLTKDHVYYIFISVASLQELIIPDELNLICQLKPAFVKLFIRVREGVPSGCFEGSLLPKQTRLGAQLINERVLPLEQLQMVYLCGPQEMYRELSHHLNEGGITNDRIFFV